MTVSPAFSSFNATNKLGRRIILGDDTEHVCAGLETFDDDHTDVVLRTVHEKVRNFRHCLSPNDWRHSGDVVFYLIHRVS